MAQLTTLERIKRSMKMVDEQFDDLLEDFNSAISAEIRMYCQCDFDMASYIDIYSGSGNQFLALKNTPIKTISSVSIDGRPVDLSDTQILSKSLVWRMGMFNPNSLVTVEYTAGFDAVPEDIQQAVCKVVNLRFKELEHMGMSSRSKQASTDSFTDVDLPSQVKDMLNKYVNVTITRCQNSTKLS